MLRLWLNKLLHLSVINICISSTSIAVEQIDKNELYTRSETIKLLAQDFESTMISKVLKSIYENVKVDPLTGGGNAESIYRELLLEEYGRAIASKGGIGLQQSIIKDIKNNDQIYQKLLKQADESSKK